MKAVILDVAAAVSIAPWKNTVSIIGLKAEIWWPHELAASVSPSPTMVVYGTGQNLQPMAQWRVNWWAVKDPNCWNVNGTNMNYG